MPQISFLVSFASHSFLNALYTTLQTLNVHVRRIEDLALGLTPSEGPVILALDFKEYPRERLLTCLRAQSIMPALAVVKGEPAHWDREILAYCREFLSWPCQPEELSLRLARGYERMAPPPFSLETEFLNDFADLNLIGRSPAFLEALALIKLFAQCEAPVLLEGQTGTGKEMAARAIHYLGLRRDYPFIPVNCGAFPDHLLENELFGHERGAYTDAREAREGLIAQAQGGTLFLDEVDSLSLKAQVALLRFLQSQEYQPLGGRQLKQADVRIVAASNANLQACVEQGIFRQDLYFRLNVMLLSLPSLGERPDDVEPLAGYFLERFRLKYGVAPKAFHPQMVAWMKTYAWPGNVRELENFVHRAFLLSPDSMILPSAKLYQFHVILHCIGSIKTST